MAKKPERAPEQDNTDPLDPAVMAKDELLGARQWRRSKIGYITGAGVVTDAIASVFSQGRGAMGRLGSMSKAAFGGDKSGRKVSPEVVGASERFVAAMQVNGKTDRDVANSIANTYRQAQLFFVLILLTVVLGAVTFFAFGPVFPNFPLLDVVFRAIPLPLLGALALRAAYTNWLFRRRQLLPLKAFFDAPDRMPAKSAKRGTVGSKPKSGGVVKALVLALALSIPAATLLDAVPAQAQTTDYRNTAQEVFGDPGEEDLFMKLLGFLLPNVGPIPAPLGEHGYFTATKAAFMTFSGTLLFIGSAIAGWQILSGLVASAKEGTVLGKAYHEVWAPARMVIGFGMLAPIAGGLCAAQFVVIYMLAWGGNLANVVWRPYIDTITQVVGDASTSGSCNAALDSDSSAPGCSTPQQVANKNVVFANSSYVNKSLSQIFEKELCYSYLQKHLERVGAIDAPFWDARSNYINKDPKWYKVEGLETPITRLFASDQMWKYDYGKVCGDLVIYITTASGNADPEARVHQAFSNAQWESMKLMQSKMKTWADKIASGYLSPDAYPEMADFFRDEVDHTAFNDTLRQLREAHLAKMSDAVDQAYNATNPGSGNNQFQEVREDAVDSGWAAAGVFYITISRIQNAVYSAAAKGFGFTETGAGQANMTDETKQMLSGTAEEPGVITKFRTFWSRNLSNIAPDLSSAGMVPTASTSDFDMITDAFKGPIGGLFKWNEDVNPLNPMQHMIDFGNTMMTYGTYGFIGAVGAESLSNAGTKAAESAGPIGAGLSGFFGTFLGYALSAIRIVSLILIAAGAIHTFVLPMIPYIMTAFFVGGMVILTVEALVAAPIWAFFHIRMDGQDFVSDVQKPGYMIAFNLILRPALMIFGLILSYIVFGAMAWFVEMTFFPTADSLASSNAAGPIGFVIMVVMVTYIHYQMAVRAFSLITQVPDRVTRWFGQGGERLGEEDDSQKTSALIVAQTSNRVEGLARVGAMAGGRPGLPRDPKGGPKPELGKGGSEPSKGSTPT